MALDARPMFPLMRRAHLMIVWGTIGTMAAVAAWPVDPPAAKFTMPAPNRAEAQQPCFESRFLGRTEAASSHAITLMALGGGDLLAVWYGGPRELHPSCNLYLARFRGGCWEAPQRLIGPTDVTRHELRSTVKIGNPALARDGAGRIHLFFVSTPFGGWAVSSLNQMTSEDGGDSWSAPRRIITSPFANLSTLVRQPGIPLADGGFYLSAYHELGRKFPELLRFDADGDLIDKIRTDSRHGSLQGSLVPLSDEVALHFLRDRAIAGGRVLQQETHDGGRTWSPARPLEFISPDASISACILAPDPILLVYNSTFFRNELILVGQKDGRWHKIATIERQIPDPVGFSYPTMIVREDVVDLVYSWKRQTFRHVRFNRAWVEKRLRDAIPAEPGMTAAADVSQPPTDASAPIQIRPESISLADALGLGGHMLLLGCVATVLPRFERLRFGLRIGIVAGVCIASVVPSPATGLAAMMRGAAGNLSLPTLVFAAMFLLHRFGMSPPGIAGLSWRWSLLVSGGLTWLYLSTTGFTADFDLYHLGYQPRFLLAGTVILVAVAGGSGQAALALGLVLGSVLFPLGVLGSPNLWDYLSDPVLLAIALGSLALPLRNRSAKSGAVAEPVAPPARQAA